LDVVLPAVILGLATLALGIANVWIVTKILEPGV